MTTRDWPNSGFSRTRAASITDNSNPKRRGIRFRTRVFGESRMYCREGKSGGSLHRASVPVQSGAKSCAHTMTHFLEDILRQPSELQRAIDYLSGSGWPTLAAAAAAVRGARDVYLTGIGASWHAALNAGSLLHLGGRPAYLLDAAEL